MRYVLGIIIIGIGFLMTWKSEWIVNNFGRINWAEEHLGMDGGTRLFWKLLGIIVIIGAFMYMFDLWGGILRGIFGSTIETVAD